MKPPGQRFAQPGCKTRRILSALTVLLCTFFLLFVKTNTHDGQNNLRSHSTTFTNYNNVEHDASSIDIFNIQRSLQDMNCTIDCCTQYKDDVCAENTWINAVPDAVQWILIIFLVCMSAMFSGLTLGLLSLDKTGLEIVMEGDNPKSAAAAKAIYPIRKKGNLLLCTLLLGNVAVNALLSILLAEKAGGLVGFLVSTFVIVIFGEIIPQALCSRYALEIGSKLVPIVKVIMILFFPVAAPLAFCLDKALGDELATTYSSAEMRKLLQIHVAEGRFDQETAEAMTGALHFKEVKVREVMTTIDKTFMLNVDERLNFDCIATIFKAGYSRIPVYEVDQNNIIGILMTKDLIFVDPEDETPIRNFISIFGRGAHLVWPDDSLGDVLRELKQGRSHLAIVRDVNNEDETQDPYYEIKGIITLEDIIEEILGDEIVDETDAFVDHTQSVRVDRLESFDWGRLRLLDAKIVDETLSYEETKAVVAHLCTNYANAVSLLSEHQLFRLVSETSVTELPTAVQQVGSDVPDDLMYEKAVPTDICTLILSGKVTVLAGADKFRSDVSSWTVLASSALTEVSYSPDFSAFVSSGPVRCLRFTRERYEKAVDASTLEKISHHEENQDESRHSIVSDHVRIIREPSHASLQTPSSLSGAPPDSDDKRRATQARRNKLIAAFQKATKKSTKDTKEVKGQDTHKPDDDDKAEESPSENDVRDSSVRFLSASIRDATTTQNPRPPSPRDHAGAPEQSKAKTPASITTEDEKSGSSRPTSSAFEYVGPTQQEQASGKEKS